MNRSLHPIIVCLAALAASTSHAQPAGERCETAVSETVQRIRARQAQDVRFLSEKRVLAEIGDEETGVTGEGRYRRPDGGTVPFTYTCTYNKGSGATSGVMFREIGSAARTADANWQPDLTHVSPQACESATAAALKDKHPRVDRIVFNTQSRRLQPASNGLVSLEGNGAAQRAPGMNAQPFTYRCEIDPRNGRVAAVETLD